MASEGGEQHDAETFLPRPESSGCASRDGPAGPATGIHDSEDEILSLIPPAGNLL